MRWWIGSRLAAAGVATIAVVLLAVSATGQGLGVGVLLPGAAEMGAPDWVRPGTRLTWYAAGASIANADYQWQESEDGAWEDPVSGKRFDQVDAATASGEGIFQLDVVALDGPEVALQWTLLGMDRSAGRFFNSTVGGWRAPAAAPEDFWIHPDLLAAVPAADLPDLKVLRGPYTAADGETYAALGILNPDRNAYSSQLFDLASGVLLSTTTRTQGNASLLHVEGQDPPEANTQLTIGRYLGTRQREGGALEPPLPAWAGSGTALSYEGTWTFVNPFDPTGPAQVWPVRLEVALGPGGGRTWLDYRATSDVWIGGAPVHGESTGVAGGAGPWWLAPEALAAMTAGMVLDEDPITGQRLTVTDVDDDAGTVTVAADVPGIPASSTYDRSSGILLAATRTEQAAGITTAVELVSPR